MNSKLNDHFRTTKDSIIKNAKRSAFLGASLPHPNICPCILRAPCITKPITKEPLDNIMLHKFSDDLDSNLNKYLTQFDPSVFSTAFYLNINKFVNPKSLQKGLFISSNPTFVYLQNNASAHFLCPKCPAPHIPIIWHRPVKGQFNPIFTGPEYTIEFPNYYHSGLIKCSFISSNRKYEHTFILSFQNRLAHTLRPTAKMLPYARCSLLYIKKLTLSQDAINILLTCPKMLHICLEHG